MMDPTNEKQAGGPQQKTATPPSWVDGPMCHDCTTIFNTLNRKHHCRYCGNIFCDNHTKKRIDIPRLGFDKPVRVCAMCWDVLLGNTDPETGESQWRQVTEIEPPKLMKIFAENAADRDGTVKDIPKDLKKMSQFFKEPSGRFSKGGMVDGTVAPGWEPLRAAFEHNFQHGFERCAQLAVYWKGELVVDLAGWNAKHSRHIYDHDSLQIIYSSGKNISALVVAMLVDRGLLSYDDLVTKHWPEFGKNGKEHVTVADVMRHEAGIATFVNKDCPEDRTLDCPATLEEVEDFEAMDAKIANARFYQFQGLDADPAQLGKFVRNYHAVTRGWIIAGIVRRVDPEKRSYGAFLAEEVAAPLGVSVHCGMPIDAQHKHDIHDLIQAPAMTNFGRELIPAAMGVGDPVLNAIFKIMRNKDEFIMRHSADFMADMKPTSGNSARGRAAEIPSAHHLANARGMAKLNAVLVNGGIVDGVRILSQEGCNRALAEWKEEYDASLHVKNSFSQGGFGDIGTQDGISVCPQVIKNCDGFTGWGGWGGSMSLMHQKKNVAVGYAMTGMGNFTFGGQRCRLLTEALAAIVAELPLGGTIGPGDDGRFAMPAKPEKAAFGVPGAEDDETF